MHVTVVLQGDLGMTGYVAMSTARNGRNYR